VYQLTAEVGSGTRTDQGGDGNGRREREGERVVVPFGVGEEKSGHVDLFAPKLWTESV